MKPFLGNSLLRIGNAWLILIPLQFALLGQSSCGSDMDGDGWTQEDGDCNDQDPETYPGADEICDGEDNDCDQEVDEGVEQTFFLDRDGDGYGNSDVSTTACEAPRNYVALDGDCDDANSTVYPEAEEACDSVDNDCDGLVDDNAGDVWYPDNDGDGFGDPAVELLACSQPEGYVADNSDCDDSLATVNPAAEEVCDSMDNDCDNEIDEEGAVPWYLDADEDGFGVDDEVTLSCTELPGYSLQGGDCDDSTPEIYPGAEELCDEQDNDCDNEIDEGLGLQWFQDMDGDGYGNPDAMLVSCSQPQGYVADSSDCNDQAPDAYPSAPEVCDAKDNDCDGEVDEDLYQTWFIDEDQDGYGSDIESMESCQVPQGYSDNADDCDDSNNQIYPNASEVCDNLDNNCDGETDEGLRSYWYPDSDGDGYGGSGSSPAFECEQPPEHVANSDDCNDNSAASYPGAEEICDSDDNDCDGSVDEGLDVDWYADADADGFGASDVVLSMCDQPPGYVEIPGDCNDDDPSVNPNGTEICDEQDNDCDGESDEGVMKAFYPDGDEDGFGADDSPMLACDYFPGYVSNKVDCDDLEASVYPGADDPSDDGIDQDCGGSDGAQPSLNLVASAFSSIQAAIDASVDGDTVWVGPGIYEESEISFDGRAIRLISTHGTESTIVDGGGTGTVFVFNNSESADALLEGLTITGGNGDFGGGITVESADPTIVDCVLSSGAASYGAGIYLYGSDSLLERLVISDNTAADYGGGIFTYLGNPQVSGCTFTGNYAWYGGGLASVKGTPTISNSRFLNNSATFGGGVFFKTVSQSVNNLDIQENDARYGGGVALNQSAGALAACLVVRNSASTYGGGIYIFNSDTSSLTNFVVTNNSAPTGGGVYLTGTATSAALVNSIFAFNSSYNLFNSTSSPAPVALLYTDLYVEEGENHNLSSLDGSNLTVEPGFLAYTELSAPSDFHLDPSSPLIDMGDDSDVDGDNSTLDLGSYGGSAGAAWDLDSDDHPDYFWPGEFSDVPEGVDSSLYDKDDLDPLKY